MNRSSSLMKGAAVSLAVAILAGCSSTSQQSALHPAGSHAQSVYDLWVWLAAIGGIVWIIVVVLMVVAVVRRRHSNGDEEDATAEGSRGRSAAMSGRPVIMVAVAGALIPAVIVTVVAAMSITLQRDIDAGMDDARPVAEVVGHQFWWEVTYPEHGVVSANEIHIPVGERVRVDLAAEDVIHSLWVPELGGKVDMIPGQSNPLWLEADEPGVYWGQCAEYCGVQHARMRLVVVAHEPHELDAWLSSRAGQPDPVPSPDENADPLVERGREVFMSSSCVYCHAVQGTAATGQVAPDLTHLGSRLSLAAGMLPNDSESLAAWILDPQGIKPGSLMPGTDIDDPDDVKALVAYLESLE